MSLAYAQGNRKDCAYFLLIGVAAGAFFLTMGGICIYVSYWPEVALSHHFKAQSNQKHHNISRHHLASQAENQSTTPNPPTAYDDAHLAIAQSHEQEKELNHVAESLLIKILGPLSFTIGIFILITVIVNAVKYNCDHEPEEPSIAFLRLASEMSLNIDPEKRKYELMSTKKSNSKHQKPYPDITIPSASPIHSTLDNTTMY